MGWLPGEQTGFELFSRAPLSGRLCPISGTWWTRECLGVYFLSLQIRPKGVYFLEGVGSSGVFGTVGGSPPGSGNGSGSVFFQMSQEVGY